MAANTTPKSAYAVLGLHKGATADEIKKQYVELVKKYDPEKHTDRFMIIQKAFDRLRNATLRAKEDVESFNFVRGEFAFNPEERVEIPEEQINQGIDLLDRKITAGEVPAEQGNPKLIQGLMMRSYRRVQKKLWAEAIADWLRVLKVDPTHQRAKGNLLHSYQTLGYSYASHELFEEAVDVWTKAAQMNPDDLNTIHNLALAHERAGTADEAARYWSEVVKRWRLQLDREPDNEFIKNCIIEALREHGDRNNTGPNGESAPAAQQAPRAPGQPAPARPGGGTGQGSNARAGGSIEDYREILRLNPNDFEAQFKIANMLMHEQKWDEAVEELKKAARSHPRNIEVLDMLGGALLQSGKVDEAFMVWKRALSIDPKNFQVTESLIRAHMNMGRMLRNKGLYTPSLVQFKALTKYLPESDEVHYEIAKTYQLKGDERSAYQEFNRVLQLNPKHKEARNGLSSLKLRR